MWTISLATLPGISCGSYIEQLEAKAFAFQDLSSISYRLTLLYRVRDRFDFCSLRYKLNLGLIYSPLRERDQLGFCSFKSRLDLRSTYSPLQDKGSTRPLLFEI